MSSPSVWKLLISLVFFGSRELLPAAPLGFFLTLPEFWQGLLILISVNKSFGRTTHLRSFCAYLYGTNDGQKVIAHFERYKMIGCNRMLNTEEGFSLLFFGKNYQSTISLHQLRYGRSIWCISTKDVQQCRVTAMHCRGTFGHGRKFLQAVQFHQHPLCSNVQ